MVAWAEARSPFYRERFRAEGFTSRDLRGWEDFARLPVTTRHDLQRPEDLVADGFDPGRLERSHTSGSTGTPTTTYFDDGAWLLGRFVLKVRARMACGLRPLDRVAVFGEEVRSGLHVGLAGRRASLSVHQDPSEIVDELRAYAPTALYGPPSHLAGLVQTGAELPTVRLVFTSAEMLDPTTRRTIEEGLGVAVMDVYGCTETKEVAWECPYREGYHVNAEWMIVDIVEGSILLTPLYNRAMPLLRYRVGDTGRLLESTCSCGRGLPMIFPTMGRSVDYVRLPDGRSLSPYTLTCAVEDVPGIRQYQIVQPSREAVVVKVVPDRAFEEATPAAIEAALAPAFGTAEVAVTVEVVPDLPREPGGKFRVVRSDVRDEPG
jgi:phenylacetate-CoA ligase